MFAGVAAVNGAPPKKVALMSSGFMRSAASPVATPATRTPAATATIAARINHPSQLSTCRGPLSRAGADAELDAIAVAKKVGAGAFVVDAAVAIDRIMGVAPTDATGIDLPESAHQGAGSGEDCGAIG